jgi:transcriptional regulator with XRE-family HTH domain
MTKTKRSELGDFLRSRREMLSPAAIGQPAVRRRTPGLRREEVAVRAGIGVDWYIRLEQGRSTSPSLDTIDAIARALQLPAVERAHLLALVKAEQPRPFVRERVPDAIRRFVESLAQPAYVTGRRWDLVAWNEAADQVFGFGDLPAPDRNVLLYVLTSRVARHVFGTDWEKEARRILALFRVTHDLWASDPAFVELLERLRRECPEFPRWWKAHDVRASRSGTKVLHTPRGTLRFEHASFQANDDPALRLVVLTPA